MTIAFLLIITAALFARWAVQRGGGPTLPRSIIVGATGAALILTWLANEGESWTNGLSIRGSKGDYYNLLVDGFMSGHTYLPVQPSPELSDPDPNIRRNAPYLLDAARYQGHYYLYYGVVPAALLMWPYSALTGHDLSPNVVTLVCTLIGLGFAVATFAQAHRRYFPAVQGTTLALLALTLGLGAGSTYLVLRSMFYEIPVAAGYACAMGGAFALWRALHGDDRTLALVGGSIAFGLAVGCRPNYILALPVLLLPVTRGWAARAGRPTGPDRARWLLAAVLPATMIGTGLAVYNTVRFGKPWEFGFSFGMNAFFDTSQSIIGLDHFWDNLQSYYFCAPQLSAYFPFFHPISFTYGRTGIVCEAMHGQFTTALLAGMVLCGAIAAISRIRAGTGVVWLGALAGIALPSLLFMCLLKIRGDRYAVDFHAAALLGILTAAGIVLQHSATTTWRKPLNVLLVAGCLGVGVTNVCGPLEQFGKFAASDPRTTATLTHATNWLSSFAHRLGWLKYGPLTATITFDPPPATAREEFLIKSGLTNKSDYLSVSRFPDGTAQFSISHQGYGSVSSSRIPIEPGRPYQLRLDWGSFYPPYDHPYFKDYSAQAAEAAKVTVEVALDSQILIHTHQRFYDAPPWTVEAATDPTSTIVLGDVRRADTPPPRKIAATEMPAGYWCFEMEFDFDAPGVSQPLLASGLTGKGNLLFVEVMADGQIRFGCDFWGYYATRSPKFKFDLQRRHRVEIFVGYLASLHHWPATAGFSEADLERHAHTLRIWVDDKPVWTIPLTHHANSYGIISIGSNAAGFNTAINVYSAPLELVPRNEAELIDFVASNLELPPAGP